MPSLCKIASFLSLVLMILNTLSEKCNKLPSWCRQTRAANDFVHKLLMSGSLVMH